MDKRGTIIMVNKFTILGGLGSNRCRVIHLNVPNWYCTLSRNLAAIILDSLAENMRIKSSTRINTDLLL